MADQLDYLFYYELNYMYKDKKSFLAKRNWKGERANPEFTYSILTCYPE